MEGRVLTGKSQHIRALTLRRKWSEREDSNLRPSGPKPDALPGCATLRSPVIMGVPPRASPFCLLFSIVLRRTVKIQSNKALFMRLG
jgi:hypothetical protein